MRITETTWRHQPAWLLSDHKLEAIVMATGAALACLRLPGDDLNPLWQPPWPAGSPKDAAKDPAYGGGPNGTNHEAALLAAALGSFPCIHRFGAPWPGESGPPHGEAMILPWTRGDGDDFVLTVTLPLARLRLRRRFRITGDTLVLATAVAHDAPAPRAIEWCEHATLGDPFLDGCTISAGIDGAWTLKSQAEGHGRFAITHDVTAVDPAAALAMPPANSSGAGDIVAARVVSPWWRVHHAGFKRTLTARWETDDFPWLAIWTEHKTRTTAPWNGRTRARGLEISTKPFPEGKPPEDRAHTWQGRHTACVIPAGAWREQVIRFTWG